MMNMGTGFQYVYVWDRDKGEAFLGDGETLLPISGWVPADKTWMLKYSAGCKEVIPYAEWRFRAVPKPIRDAVL